MSNTQKSRASLNNLLGKTKTASTAFSSANSTVKPNQSAQFDTRNLTSLMQGKMAELMKSTIYEARQEKSDKLANKKAVSEEDDPGMEDSDDDSDNIAKPKPKVHVNVSRLSPGNDEVNIEDDDGNVEIEDQDLARLEEKKSPAAGDKNRMSFMPNTLGNKSPVKDPAPAIFSNRSIRFSAQGFSTRNVDQSPKIGG